MLEVLKSKVMILFVVLVKIKPNIKSDMNLQQRPANYGIEFNQLCQTMILMS